MSSPLGNVPHEKNISLNIHNFQASNWNMVFHQYREKNIPNFYKISIYFSDQSFKATITPTFEWKMTTDSPKSANGYYFELFNWYK